MPTSSAGPTNQEAYDDRTHRIAGQPGNAGAALDGPAIDAGPASDRGCWVDCAASQRPSSPRPALQTVQGAEGHRLRQICGDTKDHQNVRGVLARVFIPHPCPGAEMSGLLLLGVAAEFTSAVGDLNERGDERDCRVVARIESASAQLTAPVAPTLRCPARPPPSPHHPGGAALLEQTDVLRIACRGRRLIPRGATRAAARLGKWINWRPPNLL